MLGARQPSEDDALSRPARPGTPGDVFAGDGAGDVELGHPAREVTVVEVVRREHGPAVSAGGSLQTRVERERCEPVLGANLVHLPEEGRLGVTLAHARARRGDQGHGRHEYDREGAHAASLSPLLFANHPLLGGFLQRAVCASAIAASTTAAPSSWTPPSDSDSHAQPTTAPTTGSSIATIPTRVAGRWRSALIRRKKGTTVPTTIISRASVQTGRCHSARFPCSEVLVVSRCPGNDHRGSRTAQKTDANRKPQASSETGSRFPTTCSARRT